jgi:hypothetical protein
MEYDPQDQDVITRLTKLKDVQGEYPENMLVSRRQSYLKRMAEIGLGISAAQGINNITENAKPTGAVPTAGTLLETAIIVAIVTEASLMAYFYRDQLTVFFRDLTTNSGIEEVVPTPTSSITLDSQEISPSPAATSTLPSTTIPTGTGIPTVVSIPSTLNENSGTLQANSTPDPNGNNGNHYGQTPQPARTKDNNGNNDKPPKDDKPPQKKPTKSK